MDLFKHTIAPGFNVCPHKTMTYTRSQRVHLESFRKRRINFMRRGNEISSRYQADVWICIRKKGKLFVYNSKPHDQQWPPSHEHFVSSCRNTARVLIRPSG